MLSVLLHFQNKNFLRFTLYFHYYVLVQLASIIPLVVIFLRQTSSPNMSYDFTVSLYKLSWTSLNSPTVQYLKEKRTLLPPTIWYMVGDCKKVWKIFNGKYEQKILTFKLFWKHRFIIIIYSFLTYFEHLFG